MVVFKIPPQQSQLPTTPAAQAEPQDIEGIKYETTAKGPRWTIKVHADSSPDDTAMVKRIADIDRMMRARFGEPT